MSFEEYRSAEGVNWSLLKHMRTSPKAYMHARNTPQKDKKSFAIGRAIHCLILEPEKFHDEFVAWAGGDRRGKERKEFAANNQGKTILTLDELRQAMGAMSAVKSSKEAMQFLAGGIAEKSIYWQDPKTGILCKARPDKVWKEKRLLVDIKSTLDVGSISFGRSAAKFGYPCQMAHYEQGCIHAHGFEPERQILIAVESVAPHDVGVFEIAPEDKAAAAYEVEGLLWKLKSCQESGEWPGKSQGVQALNLPAWVYSAEDDSEDFGLTGGE